VSADYGPLAPGQSQVVPGLASCTVGSNACQATNACAFNEFAATFTVANIGT
jgi:hypothetical protein